MESTNIKFEKRDRKVIDMLKLKKKRQKRYLKEKSNQCAVKARNFSCHLKRKKFYYTDSPSVKVEEIESPSKWLEGNDCLRRSAADRDNTVKERPQKVFDKNTYRSRISQNILARLKVIADEIPVDAKTDVDQGFFTVVAGRPIGGRFNQREYLARLGEIAFIKASATGISKYLVKRKINLFKHEKSYKEINASLKFHQLQSRIRMYNEFNQTEEMHIKEKASKEKRINTFKLRLSVRAKLIQARCRLYKLEEHWRTLRVYQTFIYQLSPLFWRKEHDHIHYKLGKLMITDLPTVYGAFRLKSLGAENSLEDLIGLFYNSGYKDKPAEMYFTNPSQLHSAFEYMIQIISHGNEYVKEVIDAANEIKGYYQEISIALEGQVKKIQKDHDRFNRAFNWVNSRKHHLQAATLEKRDDVRSTFVGDKHLKVRREVLIAGDRYMSLKKLNVEMTTILETIQDDAHYIMHECLCLSPKVARLAFIAVQNRIKYLGQVETNTRLMISMEKHLYEAYAMRTVHKRMHKDRSYFPTAKKANVAKPLEKKDDGFYTEDIFSKEHQRESIESQQALKRRPSESSISLQKTDTTSTLESSEKSLSNLELPDRDSIASVTGKSISKLSTATSSSGSSQASRQEDSRHKQMLNQIEQRRKDSASFYPNNTIKWMEIDIEKITLERKKPLMAQVHKKEDKHVKNATTCKGKKVKKMDGKVEKTEGKIDMLEMSSKWKRHDERRDVGRMSSLEDEFESTIFVTSAKSEKGKETFIPKESPSINTPEYIRWKNLMTITPGTELNIQEGTQKIQQTSKKRFRPQAESQPDIKFLESPYLPILPVSVEKPDKCQVNSNPLEFLDPKLEEEMRGFKQNFYQNKTCAALCTVKEVLY